MNADSAATMYESGELIAATSARKTQRLSGTGTTEAASTVGLAAGCMATIKGGPTAIYVRFFGSAQGAGVVSSANYDVELGPYERYDWCVEKGSNDFVAVEASDGSSAYRATVKTTSPG